MTTVRIATTSKDAAYGYAHNWRDAQDSDAEEQEADIAGLVVTKTWVDEGPTIKRFQPKDRGRAHPINKRTSHLHVEVGPKA